MADENIKENTHGQTMNDFLKSWVMVALTLIFVALYVIALLWKIELPDKPSMITRLEPIIFVIVGYYFGRLPAQANENTLKTEINRQSQKADAAQQIKEKTQQEREVLEEKIRNVKITLILQRTSLAKTKGIIDLTEADGSKNQAVETALKILDS